MLKMLKKATTALGPTEPKETRECFIGPRYAVCRDSDFDVRLPPYQPGTAHQTIGTFEFSRAESNHSPRDLTTAGWAAVALDVPDYTSIMMLEFLLWEKHLLMTLPQAEALVELTERGRPTGMFPGWLGTSFFVEGKNGGVEVANVRPDKSLWYVYEYRLDYCVEYVPTGFLLIPSMEQAHARV